MVADSDSGLKNGDASTLIHRPFDRGTRAYATMAPVSAKQTDHSKLNDETEHYSDDELVASAVSNKPSANKTDEKSVKKADDKKCTPTSIQPSVVGATKDADVAAETTDAYMIPYSIVESCV